LEEFCWKVSVTVQGYRRGAASMKHYPVSLKDRKQKIGNASVANRVTERGFNP